MKKIPVYFYIPASWWLEEMPVNQISPWSGFSRGCYAWTLQTYLYLKESGFPCQLVKEIPEEGIVISHRDFLDDEIKPTNNLLLTCLQADCGRHPYAQVHIVQNPLQTQHKFLRLSEKYLYPGKIYFMRHWPQLGLIPRNLERQDRFEHLAYFGRKGNLDSYFFSDDWNKFIQSQNIQWSIVQNSEHWSDYSEVDGIIAIRKLSPRRNPESFISKPATKLYNSWQAGVIPILGCESGFLWEKQDKFDYVEVNNIDELKSKIESLSQKVELRREILKKGKSRLSQINHQSITDEWISLIQNHLIPYYTTKKKIFFTKKLSFWQEKFKKV